MKEKEINTKDYCILGKENGCPHIDYCFNTNSFSLEILKMNNLEKKYTKIGSENIDKPQRIDKNIGEKIKQSRTWKIRGIEEITFVCTEIRKESKNNTYISGLGELK